MAPDQPTVGPSPAGLGPSSLSLCSPSLQKRRLPRKPLGRWKELRPARTMLLCQTLQTEMLMQLGRLEVSSRMQISGGLIEGVTFCSLLLFCRVSQPGPGWDAVAASRGLAPVRILETPTCSHLLARCSVAGSSAATVSLTYLAAASSAWLPEQAVLSRPCVASAASCW